MTKKEYKKYLEDKSDLLYQDIKDLEKEIRTYEMLIKKLENKIEEKEEEIAEINIELDDLEDNVWGSTHESQRAYMYDVLPHSDLM